MLQYVWLALLIVFIIVECATVELVSIWFAGGSLVAMFLAMAGVDQGWQVAVFFAVSLLLLILTRPVTMRHLNKKKTKTNYESVIGTVIKVTETVDNFNQTGTAFADGKDWTVRAAEEGVVIKEGEVAEVVAIEGVKLIVKPYQG